MHHLRTIAQWLYNRWYTVVVFERWNAVRFMLGGAMVFIAAPEQVALVQKTRTMAIYSDIYFIAAIFSALSGIYYLHIGSDSKEHTARELRIRYAFELLTAVVWVWVFSIDIQAHAFGALQLGEAEWIHHIGVNIVVSSGLALAAYNQLCAASRVKIYSEIVVNKVLLEQKLEQQHGYR
jgi:hypothetical protein